MRRCKARVAIRSHLPPPGEGWDEGTERRKRFASYYPRAISLRKSLHVQVWSLRHVGLRVVQALKRGDFFKSMTTHADHHDWQDVYHSEWNGIMLYIKFQREDDYFVVSFKEL